MILDKKVIVIVVLCFALCVVSYIALKPSTRYVVDEKILNSKLDSIQRKNDSLTIDWKKEVLNKQIFLNKIDSLQNIKPVKTKQYETKELEISNDNIDSLANDFQRVFARNKVKH